MVFSLSLQFYMLTTLQMLKSLPDKYVEGMNPALNFLFVLQNVSLASLPRWLSSHAKLANNETKTRTCE